MNESVDPTGKAALYSSATRRSGTVVLDCSRCKGRTRVSYPEFAKRHLPAWLWFPWREHSRYLVCPACENRAWVAARWVDCAALYGRIDPTQGFGGHTRMALPEP